MYDSLTCRERGVSQYLYGNDCIGENAHEDNRIRKRKTCAHDSRSRTLVADLMRTIRKSTEIAFSIVLYVARPRSIEKASTAAMFCRYMLVVNSASLHVLTA
jgi:hypothetical protein